MYYLFTECLILNVGNLGDVEGEGAGGLSLDIYKWKACLVRGY